MCAIYKKIIATTPFAMELLQFQGFSLLLSGLRLSAHVKVPPVTSSVNTDPSRSNNNPNSPPLPNPFLTRTSTSTSTLHVPNLPPFLPSPSPLPLSPFSSPLLFPPLTLTLTNPFRFTGCGPPGLGLVSGLVGPEPGRGSSVAGELVGSPGGGGGAKESRLGDGEEEE